MGTVRAGGGFSSGSVKRIVSGGRAAHASVNQAVWDFFVLPSLPTYTGPVADHPAVVVTARVGNDDGLPDLPILSWSVTQHRGERASLTLKLDNSEGWFAPGATASPFQDILEIEPFLSLTPSGATDALYQELRWVKLEITVGGQKAPPLPYFLIMDLQADDSANASSVTLTGQDFSQFLLEGDHQMLDVDAVVAVRYAKAVIAEILIRFGIPHFVLDFEDWVVPKLHRVGTPMQWLAELFEVRQIWWYFEGATMICKAGGYDRDKGAAWEFVDNQHITVSKIRKTYSGAFNEAVCVRLDSASRNLYGPKDGRGLGYETIQLAVPCVWAVPSVIGKFAKIYGHEWLNKEGQTLSQEPIYIGTTPAYSLRFIIEPLPPFQAGQTQWEYNATVVGTPYNVTLALGNGLSSSYESQYADAPDQAVRPRHANPHPIVKPSIPNETVADDFVRRWVLEALRRYCTGNLSVLFNPFVKLGDIIAITCKQQKLSKWKAMIEGRSLSGDGASANVDFDLCRPRVV